MILFTLPQAQWSNAKIKLGFKKRKPITIKTFSEYVGKLMRGGNVESMKCFPSNEFADKVIVNLNVSCVSMENRIGSHIDCRNIINIDAWGRTKGNAKFTKQVTKPSDFSSSIGKSSIFGFSARARNSRLFLSSPCEKIRTEKDTGTSGRASIIN
ncbi:hypothetical protein L3X38_016629 [Prunus dulcis]|uniref:Uncharacterized protein n=1 Tax=Prunus dulcis TaxID=3755 RepID=A0AAD4ZA02_PRUDU|nr:hypothetical protein L3X38_016629 [Prunus dulcis]